MHGPKRRTSRCCLRGGTLSKPMSTWRAQITFPEHSEALTLVARGIWKVSFGRRDLASNSVPRLFPRFHPQPVTRAQLVQAAHHQQQSGLRTGGLAIKRGHAASIRHANLNMKCLAGVVDAQYAVLHLPRHFGQVASRNEHVTEIGRASWHAR